MFTNYCILDIFNYICTHNSTIMKILPQFREHICLVNTIRSARRIAFAEINERWLVTEMSGSVDLYMKSLEDKGEPARIVFWFDN